MSSKAVQEVADQEERSPESDPGLWRLRSSASFC